MRNRESGLRATPATDTRLLSSAPVASAPAANGDPITSYKLYACDVQSFVCFVQPSGINPTRATVAGLPSGRNYTVSVEALNGIGSSGNATAAEESTTKAVPMDELPRDIIPRPLTGLGNRKARRGMPPTRCKVSVENCCR